MLKSLKDPKVLLAEQSVFNETKKRRGGFLSFFLAYWQPICSLTILFFDTQ